MLDLREIPFFSSLSSTSLARLRSQIPTEHYPQGSVIARAGEPGRHFHAIAAGAVWVKQNDSSASDNRGIFLGPGQVFGEMSLFSGSPVSATLIATKDTLTYKLDGPAFLKLLENEPSLHITLTKMLIERLRKQTHSEGRYPGLIALVFASGSVHSRALVGVLHRVIQYYSPGSEAHPLGNSRAPNSTISQLPGTISRWRESALRGQNLIVQIQPSEFENLTPALEQGDVVLEICDTTQYEATATSVSLKTGVADFSRVYIGRAPVGDDNPWAFRLNPQEIERAKDRWDASLTPTLDRLGRYLTYKEVGIALSSGAARGFAHLGVLEVFEAHGIPCDTLCGSSMGGIVALTAARTTNIPAAIDQVRAQLGSNKKVRDPALLPRSSLFTGVKVAAAAKATFGDCTFADLRLPTAVVAADLIGGERVIVNRGPVAPAILATSAIPGFYPPIAAKKRLMVDGGVVSRVPLDVLDHRRCGLRVAINVLLSSHDTDDIFTSVDGLANRLHKPLGLKAVLSAAWELLGSWGSANETAGAEIVITPKTPHRAGYDFDQFDTIVESGRVAALDRIEGVQQLVESMKQL